MSTAFGRLGEVRDILVAHAGAKNAISSAEIADLIDVQEDDTKVRTRDIILKCIDAFNLPVASCARGYFMIQSEEEFREYIDNLDRRIGGIEKRKDLVRSNYERYIGGRA